MKMLKQLNGYVILENQTIQCILKTKTIFTSIEIIRKFMNY